MATAQVPHWTDVLQLRDEVQASDGGVGELQMSLHKAVYQTGDAPYQRVDYYADITEPTANLLGFFSRVARRLAGGAEATALYHLDQGMGGGKSHALVGLYHMARDPKAFFGTDLGKAVKNEAEAAGDAVATEPARIVTLTADNFSPGAVSETFGPATDLFGRFLWALFDGDRDLYDTYSAKKANKATLREALEHVDQPVLILLDELMDYAMALSDAKVVDTMPGEKAFLNALADACDDVERVAFVVVMIRSDFDQEGYTPLAEDFRTYIAKRFERNGTTVAVTETGDFAAIIRRRIFERPTTKLPADKLAKAYQTAIDSDPAWSEQVFDRMPAGKNAAGLPDRIAATYPFHPDLMDLVQDEWGKVQGFQRVRSTVAIFALTALHWVRAAEAGDWTPALIGVGDLPVGGIRGAGDIPQARGLDALLNSGLLLGNDRAIQGYRGVATTDITSADGTSGRAVAIDAHLAGDGLQLGQPAPAVRMATALLNYSLVARAQVKRGATKAELMAALLEPGGRTAFADVEQVFIALTSEDGLGSLETIHPANAPDRFWLTIKQTLRMYATDAKSRIDDDQVQQLAWDTAQAIAQKGPFEQVIHIDRPTGKLTLADVTAGIDSQATRLVILDCRHWTLLNGDDTKSRDDIETILGVGGDALVVDNAASCVIAAVNTYQRRYAYEAARQVLTWRLVRDQVTEDDERTQAARELADAEATLKNKVRNAYRHYAYLTRTDDTLAVEIPKFDDDTRTALSGTDVWSELVDASRAVGEHTNPATGQRQRVTLSEKYVAILLDQFDRHLTPKDVVSSFYKDPRFPLVPSIEEIRSAVFGLLQPAGHDGPGTGGWELVGSDGNRLQVASPAQLAISSIQQQLRRAETAHPPDHDRIDKPGGDTGGASGDGPTKPSEPKKPTPTSYSWYRLEVTNRSLADDTTRDQLRAQLMWLADLLERDDIDPQLVTVRYELMAATSDDLATQIRSRGEIIDANRVQIEAEP